MIDLTRLMFDDGASREPVPMEEHGIFVWRSKRYRAVIYTYENRPSTMTTTHGRWAYNLGLEHRSPVNVKNFTEDPVLHLEILDGIIPATHPVPGYESTIGPGSFVPIMVTSFVAFEEVI